MWLFTPHGFYSVVRYKGSDPGPERILIRSRDRAHLERLRAQCPKELGHWAITTTPDHDYPYRVLCTKVEWITVATRLAAAVDYPNFKTKVAIALGDTDVRYHEAVHGAWDLLWNYYEETRPPVDSV